MPKNFSGGSKHKKMKKGHNPKENKNIEKYPGCEYAYIVKALGNGRFTVFCYDKKERLARICGKMRKKVYVRQGDIVMVGLREFEDDKCDIMQKFSNDAIRTMVKKGLMNQKFVNLSESVNNISGYYQEDTLDDDDIFDRSGDNTPYIEFSDEEEESEEEEEEEEQDEEEDKEEGTDNTKNQDDTEDSEEENINNSYQKPKSNRYKSRKNDSFKKNILKFEGEEIDIDDL